ncbi:type II secretion system F family protein, partial [Candidatus Desantisbacteria bacterium]|nr:type II secretion system F family protein [Candidatus Desantisbacteria bacterium]
MPIFEYKALDPSGKNVQGVIEADSQEDARKKLRKENIYTVNIKISSEKKAYKEIPFSKFFKIKSTSEIYLITRQLATLIGAGLPLVQALSIVEEQIEEENIKKIIMKIKENVTHGMTFADALSEHPKFF